ncbi:MAG: amidohydrolase family protein [Candidatus Levybacteria bacterium]|nr:amidohydrolase family protein [Candidatus Levybacteria bacterium]
MPKLTLPGLIDPHVHLRDPGQTDKEDFYTGTCAALAGGYTTILDMPNNKTPITNLQSLKEKMEIAKEKIVCDVGFYFGSNGDNLSEFKKVKKYVFGLKLYLNQTTGNFLVNQNSLPHVFSTFTTTLPILVHAEEKAVEDVIKILEENLPAGRQARLVHFCHISLKSELEVIIKAKNRGLPITCGVTPHHLFLNEQDEKTLGPFGKMKPPLRSKIDVEFLWKNLGAIDVVESDHAPHTIEEKNSDNPPFGVPGFETTLPLLLTAVSQNRLSIDEVIRLCYENPKKIFKLREQSKSSIEIDTEETYAIENKNMFTKCKWSPFNGWKIKGKIQRVFIRETKVFEDGKILAHPGFGEVLKKSFI